MEKNLPHTGALYGVFVNMAFSPVIHSEQKRVTSHSRLDKFHQVFLECIAASAAVKVSGLIEQAIDLLV